MGYLHSSATSENNVNPDVFDTKQNGAGKGAYLGIANRFIISERSKLEIGISGVFRELDFEGSSQSFAVKNLTGISPVLNISYVITF
ncbi:MAG: hypothetical protein MK198_05335 [Gracilimonas sp.]|uniref:hypothetical protein n=1 Tax=Gracilimonas sp. TaxID=1974203 RepID=UPI0037524AFB|nr:hypothetical protein [Gracilimonas sp.]